MISILLAKRKPPIFNKSASLSVKELYRVSHFGSFAMLCTGFIYSAVLTLASVYAANMNLTIYEISILLTLIVAAGAIFQWPIGYISDRMDRRKVIIAS